MGKRKSKHSKQIQEMVDRIVKQYDPEKIILFGSHARGDAGPDSDVDLLVVIAVTGPAQVFQRGDLLTNEKSYRTKAHGGGTLRRGISRGTASWPERENVGDGSRYGI